MITDSLDCLENNINNVNAITNNDDESLLYVFSWEGTQDIVKIGRTTNWARRSNTFMTAHPDAIHVRCLCSEDIMSEADLMMRHQSSNITLEHYKYTPALEETVEMLNMSTGFTPYIIKRTKTQTGIFDDFNTIAELKQNTAVPPVRISPAELRVAQMAAVGATVAESSEALNISMCAVKSHRSSIVQKCFTPNLSSALAKLFVHEILKPEDLVER